MGFALTNAPATFQRLMELVVKGLQFHKCLVYLDDVNLFRSTFEETTWKQCCSASGQPVEIETTEV